MSNERKIALWLFACAFMVFAMAVIGAITRLTESGLSITEWKPVTGALPPLTQAAWEEAFALYKNSPEYTHQHHWMELSDYKKIFFWEWLHRLWGRLIGVAYALPLLWFWVRGQIPAGYKDKLLGLLLLGGMQGFVGWFMVQSGLIDRPDVSHYRLAMHLGLALVIFSALVWVGLSLIRPRVEARHRALGLSGLAMLAFTIIWGAFVAGLDAGMIYNTFPDMNGHFLPQEDFRASSLLEQQAWVQFMHRWLAVSTGLVLIAYAWRIRFAPLAAMVFVQIGLGIGALLSQVHIAPATLHQAGAIILLSLVIISFRRAR